MLPSRRTRVVHPALPVLLLLLALLAAPSAEATSVRRLSETELIDASPLVVVAVCRATAPRRSGGRLVTDAEVEVEQVVKGRFAGKGPQRLTVVLPGGVDRHATPPVAELWPGAPTLGVGERALLFLRPSARRGVWTLVGFAQGKLALTATPDGDVVHRSPGRAGAGEPLHALVARIAARAAATGPAAAAAEVAP